MQVKADLCSLCEIIRNRTLVEPNRTLRKQPNMQNKNERINTPLKGRTDRYGGFIINAKDLSDDPTLFQENLLGEFLFDRIIIVS